MTDMPTLSLIIPCYNEEGNLRELIKAIRGAVGRRLRKRPTRKDSVCPARRAAGIAART